MPGYKSKPRPKVFVKDKQSVNDAARVSNFKLSFQYLDTSQKYGSSFKDWQKSGLLSQAMETLYGYCCSPLMSQVAEINLRYMAHFLPKIKLYLNIPNTFQKMQTGQEYT